MKYDDLKNSASAKAVDRSKLYDLSEGMADEQSILSLLDKDLKRFGYAGSTTPALLTYLATYTRTLDRPCSLVIKGPSGSGKSFASHAAFRYVPDEAYVFTSGMSDMSLLYSDWDLAHKHLFIGEAAGFSGGRGRTFLRQLMSEGVVKYQTVQHTKDGHRGEALPEIKGPVGVIMTTTAAEIHPEDETRYLSYQMDQSPERIRETLMSQARNGISKPTEEHLARWKAHHEYCSTGLRNAIIPFLDEIAEALPTSDHRVFRDFQQVQSLIKGHAIMQQGTRKNWKGSVIAAIPDYAAVYSLVEKSLAEGLKATVEPHIQEIVSAVTDWFETHDVNDFQGVSQQTIAEKMGRNPSIVSRNAGVAIARGYLKNLNPRGRGNEARLIPGDIKLPSRRVLPTVEELEMAIHQSSSAKRKPVPVN